MGWNEQLTTVNVNVVDALDEGDLFQWPLPGSPAYLTYGQFNWGGIVKNVAENNDVNGFPTYTVTCEDPREILAGIMVVMGDYYGSVQSLPNLLNVFGFWENTGGFGSSQLNNSGMPAIKVFQGIDALCGPFTNQSTVYGGLIRWRGYTYRIDLSGLIFGGGNPLFYYRIPTTHASLLDIINQVCSETGTDFFVYLDNGIIRIATISRRDQPPIAQLIQIQTFINQAKNSGAWKRSSRGFELRNDVVSAFLVGGQRTTLYQTTSNSLYRYWGFDINGQPILSFGTGVDETVTLFSPEIADVTGTTSYTVTVGELLCALSGEATWTTFMNMRRNPEAIQWGIVSQFNIKATGMKFASDFQDTSVANVSILGAALEQLNAINTQKLYQFVRGYAEQYYGKKFWVTIPFQVYYKLDTDNYDIKYSYEPTDSAFLEDGATPLGITVFNEDKLKTQDGKFQCFVKYTNSFGVDYTRLQSGSAIIESSGIFIKATIESPRIYLVGPSQVPSVIVSIEEPLYDQFVDFYNIAALNGVMGNPISDTDMRQSLNSGGVQLFLHPEARTPDYIAIPLKSNVDTYGPWYYTTASPGTDGFGQGKVYYEKDDTLTPWDYGTYQNMDRAAVAKISQALSNLQITESGSVELVGTPLYNLGQVLVVDGPIITGLQIQANKNGETTTYNFSVFTPPKFSQMSRYNVDRMKRTAQLSRENQRSFRLALEKLTNLNNNLLIGQQTIGLNRFANMPSFIKRESPHGVVWSKVVQNEDDTVSVECMTGTYSEGLSIIKGQDNAGIYTDCAMASLSAVIRPYTENYLSTDLIPHINLPVFTGGENPINATTYDPYYQNNHDIELLSYGNTYADVAVQRFAPSNYRDIRSVALRAPLVAAGWGKDIYGNTVPTGVDINQQKQFNAWKVGPVDLQWDEPRGVWTCQSLYFGTLVQSLSTGAATGNFAYMDIAAPSSIVSPGNPGYQLPLRVWNYYNSALASGTKVVVGYDPAFGRWAVISANC